MSNYTRFNVGVITRIYPCWISLLLLAKEALDFKCNFDKAVRDNSLIAKTIRSTSFRHRLYRYLGSNIGYNWGGSRPAYSQGYVDIRQHWPRKHNVGCHRCSLEWKSDNLLSFFAVLLILILVFLLLVFAEKQGLSRCFVVTCGTGGVCRYDNPRGHRGRQGWRHSDSWFLELCWSGEIHFQISNRDVFELVQPQKRRIFTFKITPHNFDIHSIKVLLKCCIQYIT